MTLHEHDIKPLLTLDQADLVARDGAHLERASERWKGKKNFSVLLIISISISVHRHDRSVSPCDQNQSIQHVRLNETAQTNQNACREAVVRLE
jgi:hypothetical protein